jgi:uncharacterized protein (TIGR03382 family)
MRRLAPVILGLASFLTAGVAVAQGMPPPPPPPPEGEGTTCVADSDCPTGTTCFQPECPVCDPDDSTCSPTDCAPGVCIPTPPPESTCSTDADCADGEFCAIYDCARPCDTSIDPDCVPTDCTGGGVCIPRDPVEPPPSCATDADCGDGNVCITQTVESCLGDCSCPDDGDPSDDPPCDCPPPSDPSCTTTTTSFCGPRWLGDCDAAEDCGPGFTCEQVSEGTCSVDSNGNESCDDAGPTRGVCQLVRVECTDDADCDNDFVCAEDTAEGNCVVDDTGEPTCAPLTKVCVPPDYDEVFPVDGEENGPRDDEDPVSPVDDGTSDDDADAPGSRVDDADDDDDDNAGDSFVLNCAQGGSVGALPLAALGLLLLRRRRR